MSDGSAAQDLITIRKSPSEAPTLEDRPNVEYHPQNSQHLPTCSGNGRFASETCSRNDCGNEQIIYTNAQISCQSQLAFRTSRSRDRSDKDCCSIVIPVGGTLSRPVKKKLLINNDSAEFKSTIKERIATMYLNEWLADIYFIVGTESSRERIPAHSFVLSVASSPFAAMFHGGFELRSEIEIPDVEPGAFKTLLKYLYTDEIALQPNNVLPTLYAAKKYLITYLYNAAIEYLEANLSANNVCLLLMQSRLFEEEELIKRCWEIVDANAEKVLTSEGFIEVDYSLMEQMISRETLIVREKTVYEAAMRWAKAECKRKNVVLTASELRNALGDALFCVRFPAMSINEFANESGKGDLLSCQQINDIFHYFLAQDKPSLPFLCFPRKGLPISICTRFQGTLRGTNQWRYCGRCDSIQFLVDRRIFVAGYGLYGSSSGPSDYKVKMELKKGKEILESIETSFCSTGLPATFPVYFTTPVQVDAYVVYTASVIIEGKDLSHFGHDGLSEVSVHAQTGEGVVGETINFYFTPSEDSKNGTGVQGGQIPDIMFYV